jgi:fucose permease
LLPRFPFFPLAATCFALFGALLVLVGSSQDELARALDLDLTRTGLLGSAVVLGVGIGVLAAGPLVDRLERRGLFLAALVITALALGSVTASMSFPRAIVHVLLAGLGGGLYETVLNTSTVERYRERAVRALTLLHAAATAGAVALPFAVSALVAWHPALDWTVPFRLLGAAHLGVALLAAPLRLERPARQAKRGGSESGAKIMTPALAALCVASFAYVGVESAITLFSIPYATEGLALDPERGRRAISFFWLGLLIGRLGFAARPPSDDARPAALAGVLAAAVVIAGVAFRWTHLEVFLATIGFTLGGVFPLLVALAGRRVPHAPGTAVGLVAGLGSLGGMAIPWMTGLAGDRVGISVAIGGLGLWCVVVAGSAMLAQRSHDVGRTSTLT